MSSGTPKMFRKLSQKFGESIGPYSCHWRKCWKCQNPLFQPKSAQYHFPKGKISRNHDFLKVVLIIIGGHPRYVQVSWGLREAILNHKSHLSYLLNIQTAKICMVTYASKWLKSRFWPKNQFSIIRPGVAGCMIYDHKCIPEVFQSCFAPGIGTRTLLDRFLGCFKKS